MVSFKLYEALNRWIITYTSQKSKDWRKVFVLYTITVFKISPTLPPRNSCMLPRCCISLNNNHFSEGLLTQKVHFSDDISKLLFTVTHFCIHMFVLLLVKKILILLPQVKHSPPQPRLRLPARPQDPERTSHPCPQITCSKTQATKNTSNHPSGDFIFLIFLSWLSKSSISKGAMSIQKQYLLLSSRWETVGMSGEMSYYKSPAAPEISPFLGYSGQRGRKWKQNLSPDKNISPWCHIANSRMGAC